MSGERATRLVGLIICLAGVVGVPVRAQQHVRLVPQLGTGPVHSVAISPNGQLVLTGGDSSILWDSVSGREIRSLLEPSGQVNSAIFSPDGRTVLTGNLDHHARLWDVGTGRLIRSFDGHTLPINSVAFSPDGRVVSTGSSDGQVRIWDVSTGRCVWQTAVDESVPFHPEIKFVSFSSDGQQLFAGDDRDIRVFQVSTGRLIRSVRLATRGLDVVALSPNQQLLLTTDSSGVAFLWDISSERQLQSFKADSLFLTALTFASDGKSIFTGGQTLKQWSISSGKMIRAFDGIPGMIGAIAPSPDGKTIMVGSLGPRSAFLLDVASGAQLQTFRGRSEPLNSATFSSTGQSILSGIMGGSARLWNVETGQQDRDFKSSNFGTGGAAISRDGNLVLTAGQEGPYPGRPFAELWDAGSGKPILEISGIANTISSIAFSPDGRFGVFGTFDNDAEVFDLKSGYLALKLLGHTAPVTSVFYSADGRFILTGSGDHTARLWNARSGQLVRAFLGHTTWVNAVSMSRDGRLILTADGDGLAILWNAANGDRLKQFKAASTALNAAAFSQDASKILVGGSDGVVNLWDVSTGVKIHSFDSQGRGVETVGFSPDGRRAIVACRDTVTRLWDTETGRMIASIISFENGGWAVTDPEGRYDSDDPDNTPGLVWATPENKSIELKQLKDDYYIPNLLASILKGERLADVKGLDQLPTPPKVSLTYDARKGSLDLNVADTGGGIGRLVVSVNDRIVARIEHPAPSPVSNSVNVSVDLSKATLRPGGNTAKAYAFDSGNQIRSQEDRVAAVNFQMPDAYPSASGKGLSVATSSKLAGGKEPQFYAIVVGTSKFGNHTMDLQYPAHDANSMATGLEIGAGKLFGKENVHLRLLTTDAAGEEAQPTKKNIVAAFAEVKKQAKSTDVLLVYLSGHGVNLRTEKDSYYYLTEDARSLEIEDNPALRDVSTVSAAELKQWMGAKDMPLKEVLILDTCAAGAANDELLKLVAARDVPPDQRRAVEFLKEATGTVILMGSAADKSSYEASRYGQGLLTYALLDGMRGRSVGGDGGLNVSRWFQNASEDVPQLARSIGGIQRPVIAAPSGVGFPVAMLDKADEARIPLAKVKPELIHLSCHDEDDNDPLGLSGQVRERLRAISQPSANGSVDPLIVYHDDMNDGPADALVPKIVYSVSGGRVNLRLRVERAGQPPLQERLNLSADDKSGLVGKIAERLVAMAALVKTPQ